MKAFLSLSATPPQSLLDRGLKQKGFKNPFPTNNKTAILPLLLALWVTLLQSGEEEAEKDEKETDKKSYGELVKNCDLSEGLFHLYTDREDGTVYLAVKNAQIGPEFLHFSYVLDGVPSLGLHRGNFLDEKVFFIRRHFKRLEFVARNTAYHFDPGNALSRAADANISEAVLASIEIAATTEDKTTHLVKADDLFLKEFFTPLKEPEDDDENDHKLVLGDLSEDRTRFSAVRNYPENSLLRVNYVYENESPKEWDNDDVTDARYITIAVQHALIAMPQNDFRPRLEDARVGYFSTRITDLTSKKSANYVDPIHRWHLKKKNPGAAKSDPIEPITWWIENTTPLELRESIRAAVLAWNAAFESAGFTQALVCEIQPDDAKWDAGDIRYNVLRWTASPDPPFGGYGPSFVNPRTGQILGADIMLEYVFLTNRIRLRELLVRTGVDQSAGAAGNQGRFPFHRRARDVPRLFCQAGMFRQENAISSRASLAVAGASKIEMDAILEEALFNLVLHEVGHTIGLSHNFFSSHFLTPDQLNDKKITGRVGLTASVMDYAPANVSRDRTKQGQYHSRVPGPYDHWAIRFGYSESTPETEKEVVSAILAESTKPAHAFGNDADDMRAPGSGIDPRIMINDLSSDPVAHAVETMERVKTTIAGLANKFPVAGESYHELRTAFTTLMTDYGSAAEILSRHIGGIHIDRSVHGQAGAAAAPFIPVPAEEQTRALKALRTHVFGPDTFGFFPPKLLASLQLQRRGFENEKIAGNEDPKIHDTVADIQKEVLDHLLDENTLRRIVDSSLSGNAMSLSQAMGGIDRAIMEGNVDSFREALQVDYIERLILISGLTEPSDHTVHAKEQAVAALEANLPPAEGGTAHQRYLRRLIIKALEAK